MLDFAKVCSIRLLVASKGINQRVDGCCYKVENAGLVVMKNEILNLNFKFGPKSISTEYTRHRKAIGRLNALHWDECCVIAM